MSDNASVMNVDGASVSEALFAANETRDIVLPNQTEHVSHIAVDVKKKGFIFCINSISKSYTVDWWFFSKDSLLYLSRLKRWTPSFQKIRN